MSKASEMDRRWPEWEQVFGQLGINVGRWISVNADEADVNDGDGWLQKVYRTMSMALPLI